MDKFEKGIIIGSLLVIVLPIVIWQSYAYSQRLDHDQDCQNRANDYNAAVARQQQDNSGFFQSIGSTLSGISAQDHQAARIEAQYLNTNCGSNI
jgi:hypothetical protein